MSVQKIRMAAVGAAAFIVTTATVAWMTSGPAQADYPRTCTTATADAVSEWGGHKDCSTPTPAPSTSSSSVPPSSVPPSTTPPVYTSSTPPPTTTTTTTTTKTTRPPVTTIPPTLPVTTGAAYSTRWLPLSGLLIVLGAGMLIAVGRWRRRSD